jgi:hypothetical protein
METLKSTCWADEMSDEERDTKPEKHPDPAHAPTPNNTPTKLVSPPKRYDRRRGKTAAEDGFWVPKNASRTSQSPVQSGGRAALTASASRFQILQDEN